MKATSFNEKKTLIVRAEHDKDLIKSLKKIAKNWNIDTATFTVIGALKNAKIEFYNQDSKEYKETKIDEPRELANCTGNISRKDGEPFVHAHAVLSDGDGNSQGGHLSEGTIFAAEIHLRELDGPNIERKHDETTDLSLWEREEEE